LTGEAGSFKGAAQPCINRRDARHAASSKFKGEAGCFAAFIFKPFLRGVALGMQFSFLFARCVFGLLCSRNCGGYVLRPFSLHALDFGVGQHLVRAHACNETH
jgi:hypothetical protein